MGSERLEEHSKHQKGTFTALKGTAESFAWLASGFLIGPIQVKEKKRRDKKTEKNQEASRKQGTTACEEKPVAAQHQSWWDEEEKRGRTGKGCEKKTSFIVRQNHAVKGQKGIPDPGDPGDSRRSINANRQEAN